MRGQIIYQASNNLSTLIIISRKKSICLELAHDQCSVYILWFITCAYHFLAVYKRSTVNVFKAHGLAQASIADCVNETFSAVRTVSNLMLCYLFLVPMRLLHYCFFFLGSQKKSFILRIKFGYKSYIFIFVFTGQILQWRKTPNVHVQTAGKDKC